MKVNTERMLKEEQELEKLMLGTPEGEETTSSDAASESTVTDGTPAKGEELVAPTPRPVKDESVESTRDSEDWEKRYKNLRSSRDEKLYKTKSQLGAALETITTLQQENQKLQARLPQVDPFQDVFTDEDRENLGEATVDAMRKVTQRATEAATKPLREQLEKERIAREAQDKNYAQQTKREAYDIFLRRISQAVPDWEAINYDPAFMKWMEGEDLDGTLRKTYFAKAESEGNAALIIRYMREFKAEGNAPTRGDKLANKITPTGEGSGATQAKTEEKVEFITQAFVNKFYDDLNRGRYKGRHSEAQAIEAKIDKATMEGRVR